MCIGCRDASCGVSTEYIALPVRYTVIFWQYSLRSHGKLQCWLRQCYSLLLLPRLGDKHAGTVVDACMPAGHSAAVSAEEEPEEGQEMLRGFAFTALDDHDEGILERLRPMAVVMYDPDIAFVRQLEVITSPSPLPVRHSYPYCHLDLRSASAGA